MKNRISILPVALLILLSWQTSALPASVLKKLTSTREQARLQVFAKFSMLPEYEVTTSGRRVDLILEDTVPASELALLPADDKMIRMVSKKKNNQTILSLYFRYPPQNVTLNSREGSASLMMDILLGNPFSSRYPDLSAGLKGVTILNRGEIDYTNPLQISSYAGNWRSLFKDYETEVRILPPPQLTLPPFPLAAALKPDLALNRWLPNEVRLPAKQNQWEQVQQIVRDSMETEEDEKQRERLLLTYAEAMVRGGDYMEPYQLLQQISLTYPDTLLSFFARFLFIYLQAVQEDPYVAFFELDSLTREMGRKNSFSSYFNILQAEIALLTGRIENAEQALKRDDVAYTSAAGMLRLLRQADVRYAKGKKIKALVSYLQLQEQSDIIDAYPRSLASFSDTLYVHRRIQDALVTYQKLTELLVEQQEQDLAMFRLAMCQLKSGENPRRVRSLLSRIQDAFPGSEGAHRARLKQVDIDYLAGNLSPDRAARTYARIAVNANKTELREEASFKQALIHALAGENYKSIELCMQILRDFRNGKLKVETRALIIQRLPQVLKELTSEQKYVEALVLAKKNRFFFARGWLDIDLLYDLAKAYSKLGVYDRAIRTYLYIFDATQGEKRQQVYIPLLSSLYDNGQYELVEDYADRYFFRYPDSPDADKVFLYRLQAILKAGHLEQAALLLDSPDRPSSIEIEQTAASLYFDLGRWQDLISKLTNKETGSTRDPEQTFQLAESFFQTEQYSEAIPLFERLREEDEHSDQAMFRLAQISLDQGARERALNQLNQLTEKGKDPLWIKMAREEIGILQLNPLK
ncbi:MAG: tetratricopeptide repeat protein [Desulfobulbaceae bacterium]|nr:tetratricopeptide repeat protein [Desulfobulbaceae bacterium]